MFTIGRDILWASVLIFSIGLLSGCETAQKPRQDPAATNTPPPADSPIDPGDPTMALLTDQAASDVAYLLGDRTAPAEDAAQPAPTTAMGKKKIIWNDAATVSRSGSGGAVLAVEQPAIPAVTPVPLPSGPVAEPPAPASTTTPAAAIQTDVLQQAITDVSRELHRNAAYSDMPLRELLAIAALSLVDSKRALNPEAMPDLSEKERELLGTLQQFFIALGESLDGARPADEVISESVATLRDHLNDQPPLGFGTVALVSRVGGFGDFDEITRRAFLAHAEERFGLYVELDNFTSTLSDKGEWVTELSRQLVIYADADGIPVWKEDWQPAVDRTKRRRTDFFLAQLITLPKALGVGKYHLKIRIRDEQSGSVAETSIEFQMVADARMTR